MFLEHYDSVHLSCSFLIFLHPHFPSLSTDHYDTVQQYAMISSYTYIIWQAFLTKINDFLSPTANIIVWHKTSVLPDTDLGNIWMGDQKYSPKRGKYYLYFNTITFSTVLKNLQNISDTWKLKKNPGFDFNNLGLINMSMLLTQKVLDNW